MVNKTEEQSRQDYLDQLVNDFTREQTIQDIGIFLLDYPAYRMPPRLAKILSDWLEKTSDRKLIYAGPGHPKTDLADYFPLIDQMRATGMSVEDICDFIAVHSELKMIRSAETLRKRYNDHRTKMSRLIDDLSYGPARQKGSEGFDYSQVEKAFERFGIHPHAPYLDRSIEKMVKTFGYAKVLQTVQNAKPNK